MKKVLIFQIDSQLIARIEEPESHLPKFKESNPIAAFDVSEVMLLVK